VAIPKKVTLKLQYMQVSATLKRIVQATISFADFIIIPSSYVSATDVGVPGGGVNGTTTLPLRSYDFFVEYSGLDWLDLINTFSFGADVYAVLFAAVGALALFCIMIFWFFHRLRLMLGFGRGKFDDIPDLKFVAYSLTVLPSSLKGTMLAMLVIVFALMINYALFVSAYPFENINGDYGYVLNLTPDVQQQYRIGRLGACISTTAMCVLYFGSKMYIPERAVFGMTSSMWSPVVWKRMHMMFTSVGLAVLLVWAIEFSFSPFFAQNVYFCIFMFKLAQMTLDILLTKYVGEHLVIAPMMVAIEVVEVRSASALVTFLRVLFCFAPWIVRVLL
jgi:hypothetical protein